MLYGKYSHSWTGCRIFPRRELALAPTTASFAQARGAVDGAGVVASIIITTSAMACRAPQPWAVDGAGLVASHHHHHFGHGYGMGYIGGDGRHGRRFYATPFGYRRAHQCLRI